MRQAGFRTPCSAPTPVRPARARPSRPGRVHRGLRASRSQRPARSRRELERTMKPRTIRAVGAGCTGRATRLVVHRPAAMLQAHVHRRIVIVTSGSFVAHRGHPASEVTPDFVIGGARVHTNTPGGALIVRNNDAAAARGVRGGLERRGRQVYLGPVARQASVSTWDTVGVIRVGRGGPARWPVGGLHGDRDTDQAPAGVGEGSRYLVHPHRFPAGRGPHDKNLEDARPTTDCSSQGAICTGDGRMLSNELTFTVNGPGG